MKTIPNSVPQKPGVVEAKTPAYLNTVTPHFLASFHLLEVILSYSFAMLHFFYYETFTNFIKTG